MGDVDPRAETCNLCSAQGLPTPTPESQADENRIEAVNGGLVTVGIWYPCNAGPFATEKEFNDFLVTKDTERLPYIFKNYARTMMVDDHVIHFALGDFAPRNIIVDPEGRVNAVIDWHRAGWLPEYWDSNRMTTEIPGIKNYLSYIHHIIPVQYPRETVAWGFLARWTGDA